MKIQFRLSLITALFISSFPASLFASLSSFAQELGLGVQSDYRQMPDPLTTESVSKLDPAQPYPHRQRWIVRRHAEILGLKAYRKPKTQFGVQAERIASIAQGYVRGPGNWYQPIESFPCSSKFEPQFGTIQGAISAAEKAGNAWTQLLKKEKVSLELQLRKISESTEESALDLGDHVFRKWIANLDRIWRAEVENKIKKEERKSYFQEAKSKGLCLKKRGTPPPSSAPLQWTTLMEPPAPEHPPITQLLARAPAKLWGQWFSIRLSVETAGKTLNGRFLIDPGAQESTLSPTWIENQGVYPLWVVAPDQPQQKVTWSGPWEGKSKLAPVANVDSVSLAGLKLPLTRFLLKESEFFSQPNYLGHCCDGVLGKDFLRLYPMEFQSTAPAEVRVWPIENFRGTQNQDWFEMENPTAQKYLGTGNVTYDYPHGRIWLPHNPPPPKTNQSGLTLAFRLEDGDRILQVTRIAPGSKAAKQLGKAGLKPKFEITFIDSKPAEEMDLPEVNNHLAGVYGNTVYLQWKTPRGLKVAPLKLD